MAVASSRTRRRARPAARAASLTSFDGRAGAFVADVFGERTAENRAVSSDDADGATDGGRAGVSDVVAVDEDLSGGRFEEFQKQIGGGGFAGAGGFGEGSGLAGFERDVQTFEDFAFRDVAKADIAEFDAAGAGGKVGAGGFDRTFVAEADGAIERDQVLLEADGDVVERVDRGEKAIEIGGEHDDITGSELMLQDEPTAIAENHGFTQIGEDTLPDVVAMGGADAFDVDSIGVVGLAAKAGFGAGELYGFDVGDGAGDAGGDVFPELVVGFQAGLHPEGERRAIQR